MPVVVSFLLLSVTCSVLKLPNWTPTVKLSGVSRTLYHGSFYWPPDKIYNDYLDEFNSSLSQTVSNRNANVLVEGDFN